jgi:hypothetical protein
VSCSTVVAMNSSDDGSGVFCCCLGGTTSLQSIRRFADIVLLQKLNVGMLFGWLPLTTEQLTMGNIVMRHLYDSEPTTTTTTVEPPVSAIPRPETLAAEIERDAFNRRAEQESVREIKRYNIEAHLAYKFPQSRLLALVRSLLLDGKRTFWVLLDDDDDSVAVGRAYLEKNVVEPVRAQGWAVDVTVENMFGVHKPGVDRVELLDFHTETNGVSSIFVRVCIYDPKNPPPLEEEKKRRRLRHRRKVTPVETTRALASI